MNFTPPALDFLGREEEPLPSLGRVLRDPTAYWPPSLLERGAVAARAGKHEIVLVANPEAASEILLNRGNRFPRARLQDRMLGKGYGENLLQGDRQDWRRQRRQIAKPITSGRAQSLVVRLALACDEMAREWASQEERTPVDLLRDTRRLALDGLYRALFAEESEARSRNRQMDDVACAIAAHGAVELKDELALLLPLAERILAEQSDRLGAAIPNDINTLTLFLHAGHDNAAAALAWALWLLANRPDLQERVREEWRAGRDGDFSASDHPMANAVVRETLRLYPPIMQLIRDVDAEISIGDVTVAPGATAVIAIYAMHRHRRGWQNPDNFVPERFLGGGADSAQRAFWTPFGSGPRGCIGSSLARVEMTLFVSMICARFNLFPNPDSSLRCHARWALRPIGEAPLFVSPRA